MNIKDNRDALSDEIARLEGERKQLIAALNAAFILTDAMLDEILALHKYSREPLPIKLLNKKQTFDNAMKELLGDEMDPSWTATKDVQ